MKVILDGQLIQILRLPVVDVVDHLVTIKLVEVAFYRLLFKIDLPQVMAYHLLLHNGRSLQIIFNMIELSTSSLTILLIYFFLQAFIRIIGRAMSIFQLLL